MGNELEKRGQLFFLVGGTKGSLSVCSAHTRRRTCTHRHTLSSVSQAQLSSVTRTPHSFFKI